MADRVPVPTRTTLVGVFDLLTRAHVDRIRSSALGGPVDVVVIGDRLAVAACGRLPITPEESRLEIVGSLRTVRSTVLVDSADALDRILSARSRLGSVIRADEDVPARLLPSVIDLRNPELSGHRTGRS